MTTYPQKITFRDHRCSHSTTLSADRWPDNIRLSDVEPDFI